MPDSAFLQVVSETARRGTLELVDGLIYDHKTWRVAHRYPPVDDKRIADAVLSGLLALDDGAVT